MSWSKKAKRRVAIRKNMRVEEACDAIIAVLEELGCNPTSNRYIKKKFLIPRAVTLLRNQRKEQEKNGGTLSHDDIKIRLPSARFILNNWKEIRKLAEEAGIYIVWKRGGVKLGTLEEYRKNTNTLKDISQGVAVEVNERVELVNEQGFRDSYVEVVPRSEVDNA